MTDDCPFCKGKGKTRHAYADSPERFDVELSCDPCSGTGDLLMMRLVRAFRLGQLHEHQLTMSRLTGGEGPRFPSADTIKSAVLDDARRQRYEDALSEGRNP